jgi:hypothetical protein
LFNFTNASGSYDNTCTLSLLRRQVQNIIICYSNVVNMLNDDINHGAYDLAALFGCAPIDLFFNIDMKKYNKQHKVFHASAWQELRDSLIDLQRRGKPLVLCRESFPVLSNRYAGVKAYAPNILFVFNSMFSHFNWVSDSSQKIQIIEKISREADATLASSLHEKDLDSDFPYVPVRFTRYSKDLVENLADIAAWSLKNNDEIEKFKKLAGL